MDDSSNSGFLVLVILVFAVGVFAFIGHLIGRGKGRSSGGAAMGAILGPVGLVGAAFLSDKRRQCPACKGHVPDDARKCMHCGEDLPMVPTAADEPEMVYDSESESFVPAKARGFRETEAIIKKSEPAKVPCPLCGHQLRVDTLKAGENWCPHCYRQFFAESEIH